MMQNIPNVKIALVGVSRDCFPIELTRGRLGKLTDACKKIGLDVVACETVIENENDTLSALTEAAEAGANAAVIYLGNFGPEGPLSIFAERFSGPVMLCAAAEESGKDLIDGRGDALCGMLSASLNLGLRNVPVYIPQTPVGLPDALAGKVAHFEKIARIVLGVLGVKIFTFGPRPQDFFACNAPIRPLYDLGVEVMENSELDLLVLYQDTDPNDPEIAEIASNMERELGKGNTYPDLLQKLARFELALKRFYEANLGSRQFGIFANKCWPAFERSFGFTPCYVNSRMAMQGMPISCEVDIYGVLSEYVAQLASGKPVTVLDINNSVPADMLGGVDLKGALPEDLFMGFHCGNTPSCYIKDCSIQYQLIMKRLMEDPNKPADITRGTLEGQIKPNPTTMFRLQPDEQCGIQAYVAEGNVLDVDPKSFGSIGVFAFPNFARFYRHIMLEKKYPHHGAFAFEKCGKVLFDAVKLLGIEDIGVPLPKGMLYPGENPFEIF